MLNGRSILSQGMLSRAEARYPDAPTLSSGSVVVKEAWPDGQVQEPGVSRISTWAHGLGAQGQQWASQGSGGRSLELCWSVAGKDTREEAKKTCR